MQGTVFITDRDDVKIHTYRAPENGLLANTHLIELPNQLIAIDAQYGLPYAQEVVDYARSLGKPISRLYVTHEHPDHFFGAALFEAPIYALPEVKATIEAAGDVMAANNHANFGDFVPSTAAKPEHTVEPGEETIDGVQIEFGRAESVEAAAILTIALPNQGVIITQDLAYNQVHLFVADRRFDEWTAALTDYEQLPYDTVLPGHGQPGGKEIYADVRDYLAAARELVAKATSGDELKASLIERFPDYRGEALLDIQNIYMFPTAQGGEFPGAGNMYTARFGDLAFRLDFETDGKTLTFASLDQPDAPESVIYTAVPIRDGVFMVYWKEAAGNTVVHVEDFENEVVHTNITMADGTFLNLSGEFTPVEA